MLSLIQFSAAVKQLLNRKSITNQMSKDSNQRVKKYKCGKENMCRSFSEENINKHVVIRQTRAPGAN